MQQSKLPFLSGKFKKLKKIYKEEGLKAAVEYSVDFVIAKTGWYHDKWLFGKLVEWGGNKVRIRGCTFRVDSPLILSVFKSRFILNRYEREELEAVRRFLDPSLPMIELGASIGIVSCVTNKKLKNPEAHVVVEANPDLIPILKANRDLNACSFAIINKASGYGGKEAVFYQHERFTGGGLQRATNKSISVPTITLAEIFADYRFECANLICDVEGGEIDLVAHEKELLSKKVFQIIFDLHPSVVGEKAISGMLEELYAVGFRKIRTGIYCNVVVLENTNIKAPKQ